MTKDWIKHVMWLDEKIKALESMNANLENDNKRIRVERDDAEASVMDLETRIRELIPGNDILSYLDRTRT